MSKYANATNVTIPSDPYQVSGEREPTELEQRLWGSGGEGSLPIKVLVVTGPDVASEASAFSDIARGSDVVSENQVDVFITGIVAKRPHSLKSKQDTQVEWTHMHVATLNNRADVRARRVAAGLSADRTEGHLDPSPMNFEDRAQLTPDEAVERQAILNERARRDFWEKIRTGGGREVSVWREWHFELDAELCRRYEWDESSPNGGYLASLPDWGGHPSFDPYPVYGEWREKEEVPKDLTGRLLGLGLKET